ncbi:hypothetical protein NIES4106_54080 (plasmid) [Fischerella sp. NIES-4106]|nr:hypothetical protein NIES4106_54080 [Fischerella sp. NIES-4106]
MLQTNRRIILSDENLVIDCGDNRLPVEIFVVAKLPSGVGKEIVHDGLERQKKHKNFIEEYNEPSAKIANTDWEKGDLTTIYTFGVEKKDLVFHRHAGHRVITAVTGEFGAVLKFSSATLDEIKRDTQIFIEKMIIVELPPDAIFVLRFHGEVYHQFCPKNKSCQGFFAISVHTNELGGLDDEILLQKVIQGHASIPLLTECIPQEVENLFYQEEARV